MAFTPLKSDALLRLLICDLVGEEVTRESLATLRDDLADIAARLDEAESRAAQLAHREKYLLLVTGFLRRYLVLHRELIDDVERELAPEANAQAAPTRVSSPTPQGRPTVAAVLESESPSASAASIAFAARPGYRFRRKAITSPLRWRVTASDDRRARWPPAGRRLLPLGVSERLAARRTRSSQSSVPVV